MELYKNKFFTLYFQGFALITICIMLIVFAVKGVAGFCIVAPLAVPSMLIAAIVPMMDFGRMIKELKSTNENNGANLLPYGLAVLLGIITIGIYYMVYLYSVSKRLNLLLKNKGNDEYLAPLLFGLFPLTLGISGVAAHYIIIKKYWQVDKKRSSYQKNNGVYKNTGYGSIRCIAGELKGAIIVLRSEESIVIGRDPQKVNLVINNSRVSRIHCKITYYDGSDMFSIVNYSSNGTRVGNVKLKGIKEEIAVGRGVHIQISQNDILEIF